MKTLSLKTAGPFLLLTFIYFIVGFLTTVNGQCQGPLKVAFLSDATTMRNSLTTLVSFAFFLGYLVHHRDQPIYPRDFEREFDFSHPTVSGVLRRLESKGFVTFQPGEKDRRCKQVLLTEKAMECHAAIGRRLMQTEQKALTGLSDAEVAELHRLLGVIMKNMGVSLCCRPPRVQEDEL